jgi:hypothetical protein
MAENEKPVEGEEETKRNISGKSMYKYIAEAWNRPDATYVKDLMFDRMIAWRREENFSRVDHPTRLDRARALGFKAKQGYVMVRGHVRKGSLQRRKMRWKGRRAKRKGINKLTAGKSLKWMVEERCAKRYPNLEVRGGRQERLVRDHPGRQAPPGDHVGPEDQLDLQPGPQGQGIPRSNLRRSQGTWPEVEGQGRGEDEAQRRRARPSQQVNKPLRTVFLSPERAIHFLFFRSSLIYGHGAAYAV